MNSLLNNTVRVKWLQPACGYSYFPGDVCFLQKDKAKELHNSEIVKILPEDWKEPVQEKKAIPDEDMIPVVFLEHHPAFSYNAGEKGIVTPDHFTMLQEGGFVKRINKPIGAGLLEWLKLI